MRVYDLPYGAVEVVSPPTTLPVTEEDLRTFAHIEEGVDVSQVLSFAVAHVERSTRVALGQRTLRGWIDGFPCDAGEERWWDGVREGSILDLLRTTVPIRLPWPPLVSVDQVEYRDRNGVWQTVTDYDTNTAKRILYPLDRWPTDVSPLPSSVRITWTAGYDASTMPLELRALVLELAAWLWDTRAFVGTSPAQLQAPEWIRQRLAAWRMP